MPELPEVERAAKLLRERIVGKTIADATLLHASLRRRLGARQLRALRGASIAAVDRRGKHQLIILRDGRVIRAHFRMTGDWRVDAIDEPLPRFARAVIAFTDGTRLVLDDSRALSTLELHPSRAAADVELGPEPDDPALTPEFLAARLSNRRGPIKPVLLDQKVIAGLGNIYAAEALWRARISPRVPARDLTTPQLRRLLASIRAVIAAASGARYRDSSIVHLAVYDHEGKPCRRCRTTIERIVQSGRSTWYCPNCQR